MLVFEALRIFARSVDGVVERSKLVDTIVAELGLSQPSDLIPAVYRRGWDRQRLATLAPLVLQAAQSDPLAAEVVQRQADELAKTAVAAVRKLGLEMDKVPLGLTGGVMLGNEGYRERFFAAMRSRGLRCDPITLVHEPATGAVRIARELLVGRF
jgi:N-acetylglucosamine kinase-like BadF-type ATPase